MGMPIRGGVPVLGSLHVCSNRATHYISQFLREAVIRPYSLPPEVSRCLIEAMCRSYMVIIVTDHLTIQGSGAASRAVPRDLWITADCEGKVGYPNSRSNICRNSICPRKKLPK